MAEGSGRFPSNMERLEKRIANYDKALERVESARVRMLNLYIAVMKPLVDTIEDYGGYRVSCRAIDAEPAIIIKKKGHSEDRSIVVLSFGVAEVKGNVPLDLISVVEDQLKMVEANNV